MSPKLRSIVALLAVVGGGSCGKSTQKRVDAGNPTADADADPLTPLQSVATIVVPKCAVAGCHDAVSKTHSMDLSTPEKIHSNWVNVRGFDHCTNMDTPRVIPGDPDASLVVLKIEGVAVCLQSQRMPLPPRDPLSTEEIAVIRAWIAAGAPSDNPHGEDGGRDASEPVDAADDGGPDNGGPDDGGGYRGCSITAPCEPGFMCDGVACSDAWECVTHFDETLEHPCAPETILWCGCDGVTFEASVTCPDRPWTHPGACGDGVSCTKEAVRCADPKPVCAEGEAPSVINDCWGPCVPVSSCRCIAHWMCPTLTLYTCLPGEHCGPNPRIDAGTDAPGP
jgi:hypothetical protein